VFDQSLQYSCIITHALPRESSTASVLRTPLKTSFYVLQPQLHSFHWITSNCALINNLLSILLSIRAYLALSMDASKASQNSFHFSTKWRNIKLGGLIGPYMWDDKPLVTSLLVVLVYLVPLFCPGPSITFLSSLSREA